MGLPRHGHDKIMHAFTNWAIVKEEGSVRILQAYVLYWVLTCIDHGEQNNGSGTVSGLGFQYR